MSPHLKSVEKNIQSTDDEICDESDFPLNDLQSCELRSVENSEKCLDQQKQSEIVKVKSKKKFVCPYKGCEQSFIKKDRLQTHIRMKHTNCYPYSCSYENCSESFACKTYLNKHIARHERVLKIEPKSTEKRKYSCSLCTNQQFHTKHLLRKHLVLVHQESLPFQCEKCDLQFHLRSRLKAHQRRHRGYDCSFTNCDFHTDKWSLLRKHLSLDHRKLECNICRKTYKSHYNLRIHEQTVHNEVDSNSPETQFKCTFADCDKWYLRSSSLKTHIRTFHCEPKHICSYSSEDGTIQCGKKFRHKKSLIHHIEIEHSSKLKAKKKVSKRKTKCKNVPRFKPVVDEKQLDVNDQLILKLCEERTAVDICLEDLHQSNLYQTT